MVALRFFLKRLRAGIRVEGVMAIAVSTRLISVKLVYK